VLFLWAVFFAIGLFSPPTFAYDQLRQAAVAYDAPSLPAFNYEVAFAREKRKVSNHSLVHL
jgi:hypothetical protein